MSNCDNVYRRGPTIDCTPLVGAGNSIGKGLRAVTEDMVLCFVEILMDFPGQSHITIIANPSTPPPPPNRGGAKIIITKRGSWSLLRGGKELEVVLIHLRILHEASAPG